MATNEKVDLIIQRPKATWNRINPDWLNEKKEYLASFGKSFRGHYIEEGQIKIKPTANSETVEYDPFIYYHLLERRPQSRIEPTNREEKKSLYLKFINLDENNDDQILDFVDNYGFLGLNRNKFICYAKNEKNELGFIIRQENDIPKFIVDIDSIDIDVLGFSEPIEDFRRAVIEFRTLIDLFESIYDGDEQKSRDAFKIYLEVFREGGKEIYEDVYINKPFKRILNDAIKYLNVELNNQLSLVYPNIKLQKNKKDTKWYFSSLLSAMYVMFYLDITNSMGIKKCIRSGCGRYFKTQLQGDGRTEKRVYCSYDCAHAVAEMRNKKRKRLSILYATGKITEEEYERKRKEIKDMY